MRTTARVLASVLALSALALCVRATTSGFCYADLSTLPTLCPCGNPGYQQGTGCPNSTVQGQWGTHLSWSGVSSRSADTFALTASCLPIGSSALFFQGTANAVPSTFGDGVRCVGGSCIRLGVEVVGNDSLATYPGPGDLPISVRGNVQAPGARCYQVWYRDAGAFCTLSTSNLTAGVETTWDP